MWVITPLSTSSNPHNHKQKTPKPKSGSISYWSWQEESNPQPADYKSAALPIELCQHHHLKYYNLNNSLCQLLTYKSTNSKRLPSQCGNKQSWSSCIYVGILKTTAQTSTQPQKQSQSQYLKSASHLPSEDVDS